MANKDKAKIKNLQYFTSQQEWEEWLRKFANSASEVWLLFYRPHTNKRVLNITETLQSAKKHNWKHTLIKRIDDDSYARKFVPSPAVNQLPPEEQKPETQMEKDNLKTGPVLMDDVFISKKSSPSAKPNKTVKTDEDSQFIAPPDEFLAGNNNDNALNEQAGEAIYSSEAVEDNNYMLEIIEDKTPENNPSKKGKMKLSPNSEKQNVSEKLEIEQKEKPVNTDSDEKNDTFIRKAKNVFTK